MCTCANISLSDLESSGAESFIREDENLDQHQILTSTPIRVVPGVCNESAATDSPIAPGFSPVSLSSNEFDDDSEEEESTIAEQQQESQPTEEDNVETQSLCGTRGVKLVGDNVDKTIHPRRQRSDRQTQSLHYHGRARSD